MGERSILRQQQGSRNLLTEPRLSRPSLHDLHIECCMRVQTEFLELPGVEHIPVPGPINPPPSTAISLDRSYSTNHSTSQSQHVLRNEFRGISYEISSNLMCLRKHWNIPALLSHNRLPRKVRERYGESAEIRPHSRVQCLWIGRPHTTRPETAHFITAVKDYWSKCPSRVIMQECLGCDQS